MPEGAAILLHLGQAVPCECQSSALRFAKQKLAPLAFQHGQQAAQSDGDSVQVSYFMVHFIFDAGKFFWYMFFM